MTAEVVRITAEDTYALRTAVLRDGDASRSVVFPEDHDPGAFHLGVRADDGRLVATSSWIPRPLAGHEDVRAVQLRGMATATELQRSGVGGLLFEAGVARSTELGFDLVWARARDSALPFYAQHRCVVLGDGFIDDTTGLPHHIVVRQLHESPQDGPLR
jgi:predicted GNAT family N-acyltransferase